MVLLGCSCGSNVMWRLCGSIGGSVALLAAHCSLWRLSGGSVAQNKLVGVAAAHIGAAAQGLCLPF